MKQLHVTDLFPAPNNSMIWWISCRAAARLSTNTELSFSFFFFFWTTTSRKCLSKQCPTALKWCFKKKKKKKYIAHQSTWRLAVSWSVMFFRSQLRWLLTAWKLSFHITHMMLLLRALTLWTWMFSRQSHVFNYCIKHFYARMFCPSSTPSPRHTVLPPLPFPPFPHFSRDHY